MKNLINDLAFQDFKKEIADFGITEILFINGEDFHITSNYRVPWDLVEKMERALLDAIFQKEIDREKNLESQLAAKLAAKLIN
jgi:hypothetical protein